MRESSFISNFKIIIRVTIFLLCIVLIMYFVGPIYEKASRNNIVNYFTKARYEDFYKIERNSLDMVFIGSSHSYCTFDPENFDQKFGTLSHQLGTPLQHPDTSYYVLKEVLNYQKPKLAVVELYWDVMDDEFEMKQANSFFEVLQNEELYHEYISEVFPLSEKVKYKLLPIRFQQDFFAYKANEIEKKIEEKFEVSKKNTDETNGIEKYKDKGYVYCDTILPTQEYDETNQYKNFDGKEWKFNKTQKKYLKKIIELCNENNIELVFVTAPVANVSMDFIQNYEYVNKQVSDFAKENHIKYIDYNLVNRNEGLLKNENFRDDAHLNDSGVKIVDEHFAAWLSQNTDLENIMSKN